MASQSVRRVAGGSDWFIVAEALHRIAQCTLAPTKLMHRDVDWLKAYNYLTTIEGVYIVGGYLVVYEVGTPWYSNASILSELLIVRVGRGGTIKGVAQFLRKRAKALGADFIAVGTAFAKSDPALSRLYQAQGFTPEAITLTSEP